MHIVANMFVTSELSWLVWVQDVQRHGNSEILFYYVAIYLLLYSASVIRLHFHKVPAVKTTTPLPHLWVVVWVIANSGSMAESSIWNYQTGNKTNVLWSLASVLNRILRLGLLEELKWQGHQSKFWLNEDMVIRQVLSWKFWKLNY